MRRRQGRVHHQLRREQASILGHPHCERYQFCNHDDVLHLGRQSGRLQQLQQMGLDWRNRHLLGITIRMDGNHSSRSMEIWRGRLPSWIHFVRNHTGLLRFTLPPIGSKHGKIEEGT